MVKQNTEKKFLNLIVVPGSAVKILVKRNHETQIQLVRDMATVESLVDEHAGDACFITINPLKPEATSKGAGSVIGRHAFLIDIDVHIARSSEERDASIANSVSKLKKAVAKKSIIEPTMITHTGRGLQLFYVLDKTSEDTRLDAQDFQALVHKIKKILSGAGVEIGLNTNGLHQYARIPGTTNADAKRKCKIIAASGRKYSREEFHLWCCS
ncbi:MAG: hypothetical protein K5770_14800 [Lachnospiraceae bacterium]|nr:hypothetical protein [Lachnospiraceae bacterium]